MNIVHDFRCNFGGTFVVCQETACKFCSICYRSWCYQHAPPVNKCHVCGGVWACVADTVDDNTFILIEDNAPEEAAIEPAAELEIELAAEQQLEAPVEK